MVTADIYITSTITTGRTDQALERTWLRGCQPPQPVGKINLNGAPSFRITPPLLCRQLPPQFPTVYHKYIGGDVAVPLLYPVGWRCFRVSTGNCCWTTTLNSGVRYAVPTNRTLCDSGNILHRFFPIWEPPATSGSWGQRNVASATEDVNFLFYFISNNFH